MIWLSSDYLILLVSFESMWIRSSDGSTFSNSCTIGLSFGYRCWFLVSESSTWLSYEWLSSVTSLLLLVGFLLESTDVYSFEAYELLCKPSSFRSVMINDFSLADKNSFKVSVLSNYEASTCFTPLSCPSLGFKARSLTVNSISPTSWPSSNTF